MKEPEMLNESLDAVDDMVDRIGKIIINIAHANDDFVCMECMRTASALYRILEKYAREEDCFRIAVEYGRITGEEL